MRKKKPKFQKFEIPNLFLDQIYEMSGGADKNKGYFLCYIDEDGTCQLKYKYDSQATEFAINKFIEMFLNQYQSTQYMDTKSSSGFFDEDEEDDWQWSFLL